LATGFADDFATGLAAALAGVLDLDTGLAFVTGLTAFLAATFDVALVATLADLGAGFLDLRSAGMETPRLQSNKKTAPKNWRNDKGDKGKPLNGKGSGRTFGVQSLR
jgi:hypothetical protein